VRYRLELQESVDSGAAIVSEVLTAPSGRLVWRTGDSPVYYAREDGFPGDYFSFPWSRSALSQVPPDSERYPTANLARTLLSNGVQTLGLNGGSMGVPCPLSAPAGELLPTGNNLARVAGRLINAGADEWIYHLRLALEDLESISWRQREDDRAEYLTLHYRDGLKIPSWLASFGTLRTLALTLPAFLPADEPRLYLFEEPENGIHPKAIEIVMSAIQSIPNAQTFVTTHSPMIVQQSGVDSLLLFSKRDKEIVVEHGGDNAILRELDGVPDLATVFASRVLG
jgi:AAA domain, putative AbiEii toxin, Type IV TA system